MILIKNATLVTMNSQRQVLHQDLLIDKDKISQIGSDLKAEKDTQVLDASECYVIPGLVQTHTHLVQALFRGWTDDLPLLEWLKEKIWPMEFAHNEASIEASCQIALLELQLTGTTSILDMATLRHTENVFEQALKSGIRYFGGKCLMDIQGSSGPLYESTKKNLTDLDGHIKNYHKKHECLDVVINPRFAVSCSEELLLECRQIQKNQDLLVHIHASENKDEIELIRQRTGRGNVEYLSDLGLLNPKTVIVHGVHLSDPELELMIENDTKLAHCPGSNLKLASGIAPVHRYAKKGLCIGIGTDGAPCNNHMDAFREMYLTALLQKPFFGSQALCAQQAFEMMTLNGAKILGQEDKIGSLEVGKKADIVVVRRDSPAMATVENPYSALVYSGSGRDVRDVMINGQWIVKNHQHQIFDSNQVFIKARKELKSLFSRISI